MKAIFKDGTETYVLYEIFLIFKASLTVVTTQQSSQSEIPRDWKTFLKREKDAGRDPESKVNRREGGHSKGSAQ